MEYESDILKRLIKTYGVVGNPRYISEIIKEFIVQGKERFPELFTYQSDWLAHIDVFGLNPSYTVSYTGQSFYAPNTLEKPVKSAILKGSTKYRDIDTGEFLETFEEGRNLELVSVKMPVLTTIGKNLFNKEGLVLQNKKRVRADNGEFVYSTSSSGFDNYFDCQFLQGKTINVSSIATDGGIAFYTIDKTYIKGGNLAKSQLVPENAFYYRFSINVLDTSIDEAKIQIEVNSVATLYEPHKTNILTTSEEVTLGGIGDVQDTLDCLTGELSQRIGEIVLNGSENWESHAVKTDTMVFKLYVNTLKRIDHHIISDRFPTNAPGDVEKITNTGNTIYTAILKSKADNLKKFKSYLSQNPMTVQYQLATESVKTVDLTILDQYGQNVKQLMTFNGGTHFNAKSLEGSPLPSISVTVETDLAETLKVCSLEGNTM